MADTLSPLLNTKQCRVIEDFLIDQLGIPALVLMENAGRSAADMVFYGYKPKRVLFLLGKGNNAGDGLVAARYLKMRGVRVDAIHFFENTLSTIPFPPDSDLSLFSNYYRFIDFNYEQGLSQLKQENIEDLLDGYDVIVDAVFGIGQNRLLPSEFGDFFALVNKSNVRRVALDISSGIDTDTGISYSNDSGEPFKAHLTVTFFSSKTGLVINKGKRYSGQITVCNYGFDVAIIKNILSKISNDSLLNDWNIYTLDGDDGFAMERDKDVHKYKLPCVHIVGGFHGMQGAGELNSYAALELGSGIVRLFSDAPLSRREEIIYRDISESSFGPSEIVERSTAIVLGSGIQMYDKMLSKIVKYVATSNFDGPIVLDAAAIRHINDFDHQTVIITPHIGELKQLVKELDIDIEVDFSNQYSLMCLGIELSIRLRCIVVVKGNPTFICGAGKVIVDSNGGPELATPGAGDVLAGMIGNFASRQGDLLSNVAKAVRLHGLSARHYSTKYGINVLKAGDIIESFKEIM